jgi:hypothetical protein
MGVHESGKHPIQLCPSHACLSHVMHCRRYQLVRCWLADTHTSCDQNMQHNAEQGNGWQELFCSNPPPPPPFEKEGGGEQTKEIRGTNGPRVSKNCATSSFGHGSGNGSWKVCVISPKNSIITGLGFARAVCVGIRSFCRIQADRG